MRDPRSLLLLIGEAIEDILAFVEGADEIAFAALPVTDSRTYRAIKNALVEIAEAVKQLPQYMLVEHQHINWQGFAALQSLVVLPTFTANMSEVWVTVADELPALLDVVNLELTLFASLPFMHTLHEIHQKNNAKQSPDPAIQKQSLCSQHRI